MTVLDQARRLIESGRPQDALALVEPLLATPKPAHAVLVHQAYALRVLKRNEEALIVHERLADLYSDSAAAWYDLADAYLAVSRGPPARAAAEKALRMGFERPQAWLVLGNACLVSGDLEAAEQAYREALRRWAGYVDAARLLAQLVWTRTGDADAALAPLKAFREAGQVDVLLLQTEVKVLEAAGRVDDARAILEQLLTRSPDDPALLRSLGQMLLEAGEFSRAALLMEKALERAPDSAWHLTGLATARLAQGRAEEALTLARRATEVSPLDQSTWGWLATAARAAGDPAHGQLNNYVDFVRTYRIEPPQGWDTLEAFLADLAAELRRFHVLRAAPSEQSLRNGTQTAVDLALLTDPAIRGFFQAIDAPIRRYLAEIGEGEGPLRSRNIGDYRVAGAWSVLLKPNGFHLDHFHPDGWISSAFYVETPAAALETESREGWIKFGQPPFSFEPAQPPEHFVKPEPGLLVLFPSYMWHGTVPFTSDERRMTIAFDLLPK
jgi:tetratricopeptide (TPR) repeat protein